jgi:molecular chaperone GrpE
MTPKHKHKDSQTANQTDIQPEEDLQSADQAAVEEIEAETNQLLEALQQELAECRSKSDEYLDGWQRARAEFTNYRKRVERDQALMQQTLTGSIVKRYLEIVDDLDRALKNRPQEGEGASWADGIELIYRKLINILESNGVTIMPAGAMFDPNLHEAITSEDSDQHQSGEIIEVVQQGYLLSDRVLRPALVRVAR